MAAPAKASRDTFATEFCYFAKDPPQEVLRPDGVRVLGEAKGISREEFKRRRQAVTDPREIPMTDARSVEGGLASWSLDKHGFAVFPSPQPFPDFRNAKQVMEEYYPKLIELARQMTGAKHGVELSMAGGFLLRSEKPKSLTEAYAAFAHTDASPESEKGWRKLLRKRGVPEEEAQTCDICMYNVWHPFDRPAYKNALCLLDGTTGDILTTETVRYKYEINTDIKDGNGNQMYSEKLTQSELTSLGPVFNPAHRWVFIPDQKPEEAWIFKQYDTREGVVKNTFHNSFYDPFHASQPNETHGRRSVEFRFMLTYPKKDISIFPSKL